MSWGKGEAAGGSAGEQSGASAVQVMNSKTLQYNKQIHNSV